MTAQASTEAERRRWLAVLARAPRDALEQALVHCEAGAHEPVRPPEIGMVMVRGRIGGTGDAFNLGEATVTRCAVRLHGRLGVGYTLGRDRRKAELVAILDAHLQDPQRRALLLQRAVEPLARAQARARDDASRAAAASRVQFFTMVREAG